MIDPAEYWMTPDEERKMEDKRSRRRVHYLEDGEYIQRDDEFLNNGKWEHVSYGMVGYEICNPLVGRYRRFES
jgi:hypothetical protein|tara:strand:- start:248 stop:466 length:219 start_codon:yes stop_codon:yes gene_type:complete